MLILISLFTLGHTTALLFGAYGVVSVSVSVLAFLIPITILVAAIFNIFTAGRKKKSEKSGIFYVIATFFGLIHGFGFVSSFDAINSSRKLLPMFEFELGVVAAQIIVVIIILIINFIFQTIFRINKRDWILVISSIVVGMLIPKLVNNWMF